MNQWLIGQNNIKCIFLNSEVRLYSSRRVFFLTVRNWTKWLFEGSLKEQGWSSEWRLLAAFIVAVMITDVVGRGGGSSEEGDPPAARSVFGLARSVPSITSSPEPGKRRLPERSEHLPPGAGGDASTGELT